MFRRGLLTLVVGLSFTLYGCGGDDSPTSSGSTESPNRNTTQNTPTLILAVGDSIGTGHNLATPWPSRVQSSTGVTVINQSKSSRKTSDVVGNVPAWMDQYKPSHLMVLLGTNDARGGSVDGAVTNISNWVNSARQRGITVIVGTIPPNRRDSGADARAASISAGIRNIGGAKTAEVRGALGDGSGYLADGIHPNNQGQAIIANTFVGQLR